MWTYICTLATVPANVRGEVSGSCLTWMTIRLMSDILFLTTNLIIIIQLFSFSIKCPQQVVFFVLNVLGLSLFKWIIKL